MSARTVDGGARLREWGRQWAREDAERRPQEPNAPWGNLALDWAYRREWRAITGRDPWPERPVNPDARQDTPTVKL